MNNIVLITIGVTLGIGGTVMALLPLLKKKGVQTQEILKKADTILDGANTIVNVADKLLPNNPIVDIMANVSKYAHIGVHEAEQLYLASNLSKNDRSIKAKETISTALKLMGIDITEEIEKVIDATIEMECLALGHKDKSQQELQVEKEKLQQENNNLKDIVSKIQGIVPVQ